ncbi:hypothetical protein GCM10008018_05350 [Paenibacillus marchantiophytorum]|uniref:Uncharacterized protein n=1 Tax=Paenibacillus marchantiophytorum TaxID=1619310 RepID=A0ABQ2BQZ6_9BACL|nr:hypothetical protein GCM10008018_05350 [Paenibacillus marchantiophytorum]
MDEATFEIRNALQLQATSRLEPHFACYDSLLFNVLDTNDGEVSKDNMGTTSFTTRVCLSQLGGISKSDEQTSKAKDQGKTTTKRAP